MLGGIFQVARWVNCIILHDRVEYNFVKRRRRKRELRRQVEREPIAVDGPSLEALESGVRLIGSGGNAGWAPLAIEAAEAIDKSGGVRPIDEVRGYAAAAHSDAEIVADLEMKVGRIHA